MTETVWMRPNHGDSEPREFEAKPEILVPAMVSGWSQCDPPQTAGEVNANVDD